MVEDLHCHDNGRPSIDPVVLFKIILIKYIFGIRSIRQTIKEIEVNMAYRWFLGYGMTEKIPHFTTFGKNYERRFADSDVFEKIFEHILLEAVRCKFVDASAVFIDATHIKASANKKKAVNAAVKVEAKHYHAELMEEINADRDAHGKKPLKDGDDDDTPPPTKDMKVSTFREYKSNPKICANCPSRHKCTESKNCVKVVTRHVWEDYIELAEDVRHSPEGKEIYAMRGKTIERVSADAKEKHFMRYTQYRG